MKNLILTLLLVLGLVPVCLAQDDFSATALRLGGGFGEQAEAVEKLGLSGDPRALPLLQALADGKLTRMADGALLIGEADALTGAPANAAGASPVRINNRVRAALRIALGRLQIVSPDPAERLRAADGILRSRSAQDLPLLDAALARETVPRIRERLVLAQGAARLASDDEALKRAGIESLGASGFEAARTCCWKRARVMPVWPRRLVRRSRGLIGNWPFAALANCCSRGCRWDQYCCWPHLVWRSPLVSWA